MRFALSRHVLVASLFFSAVACAQSDAPVPGTAPTASATGLQLDGRAALIEIVPPRAIQQAPAAVELIDRLMRKHVLLLQHPSVINQVLQNPDVAAPPLGENAVERFAKAVRVRVIPETNVIELSIDPTLAGDDMAVKLAEELINQHLENERTLGQNALLERSVMLNNLKQRYQFRKDELSRDLRERAVKLSIDGMGTPGRLSAKEVELSNLLQLSFELERKKAEAAPDAIKAIETQLAQVRERIDAAKADLGDLTNAMNQYLTLKDDEETTRELLKDVNEQLDHISQNANVLPEIRWLCKPSRG